MRARFLRCVSRGVVLLAVAPALLAAQAQPGRPSLDPAIDSVIAPIVARTVAAGLPAELLYAKAREGQVRRVPVDRIEATVRTLAQRIEVANEALKPNPSAQELRAATDALAHNVPVGTLRDMRRAAENNSLAVPLGVLTALIARGVSVEQATVKVVDLLQRGALPRNFIALEARVTEDVLAGRPPGESLDLRMKGILPNLPQPAVGEAAADFQSTSAGGNRRRP